MKLSFVIPAYNEQEYLSKCLGSIIDQKLSVSCEVEIIVVNNASTDHTKEIALKFPGVRVIDEPRKGITFARQAGFAASTGDLIANVDADSILTPGWIAAVTAWFGKKKDLVALRGPLIYYDFSVFTNLQIQLYYFFGYLGYLLNRFVLHMGSMLQGGNFVVRRSALKTIGGFNSNIAFYGEDTEIAKRLSKVGPTVFTFFLPMYSSARRIKYEGLLTMAFKYSMNLIWITFFQKPFTKDYIDVRPTQSNQTINFQTTVRHLRRALLGIGLGLLVVLIIFFWVAFI